MEVLLTAGLILMQLLRENLNFMKGKQGLKNRSEQVGGILRNGIIKMQNTGQVKMFMIIWPVHGISENTTCTNLHIISQLLVQQCIK